MAVGGGGGKGWGVTAAHTHTHTHTHACRCGTYCYDANVAFSELLEQNVLSTASKELIKVHYPVGACVDGVEDEVGPTNERERERAMVSQVWGWGGGPTPGR